MADIPHVVVGPDGTRYCAPSAAAARLAKTSRQIETLTKTGSDHPDHVRSTSEPAVLDLHRAAGRRPTYLVCVDDIETLRRRLLDDLGVADATEELEAELARVRTAWETDVLSLTARLDEVEAWSAALLEAVESRVDAAISTAEADRAFVRALRAHSPSSGSPPPRDT